jgi:hypothetical protein
MLLVDKLKVLRPHSCFRKKTWGLRAKFVYMTAGRQVYKFGAVVKWDYAAFATLSHGFNSRRLHHPPSPYDTYIRV